MKKIVIALAALVILLMTNAFIYQKESQIESGRTALLRIGPVDPRSLAQGDYIQLSYELMRKVPRVRTDSNGAKVQPDDGALITRVDDDGVAQFVRLDDGTPIAADELRLAYTYREGQPSLGVDAFFFEEGMSDLYAKARYAEIRVTPEGKCLLVDLRDEDFIPMGMEPR
ncbi:MAG: GDYXXLXY domain-containing protein [Thermoleophilia bacterium]|nr:GDYXXLXY domain-containing protein [Thermoleophilia bacterium]